MKTNVTYLNEKYSVNEEKQTVTCVLDWGIDLNKIPNIDALVLLPKFAKYIHELTTNFTDVKMVTTDDTDIIQVRTVGVARAHGSDEFDVNIGKKLALTRAQRTAFNTAGNIYADIVNIIHNTFRTNEIIANNAWVCSLKCKNHEYELTNYTPNNND